MSRDQQSCDTSEDCRGVSSLPRPAPGGPRHSFACGHITRISASRVPRLLCCLYNLSLSFSYKDITGFKVHLDNPGYPYLDVLNFGGKDLPPAKQRNHEAHGPKWTGLLGRILVNPLSSKTTACSKGKGQIVLL